MNQAPTAYTSHVKCRYRPSKAIGEGFAGCRLVSGAVGVKVDGVPFFVGKDVALALGYVNSNKALDDHCKGITKRYPLQTAGGMQEMRIISEPDLMRLVVGSTLPAAQKFEKQVFEEILPTIRKTGSYSVKKSQNLVALAESLAISSERGMIEKSEAQKIFNAAALSLFPGADVILNAMQDSPNNLIQTTSNYSNFELKSVSRGESRTMTALLRERKLRGDATSINKRLESLGILESVNIVGASKYRVNYWKVTSAGKKFGHDVIVLPCGNSDTPATTHPKWYVNRFMDLMKLVYKKKYY